MEELINAALLMLFAATGGITMFILIVGGITMFLMDVYST
jgi:hypothetical protein